MHPDTASIIDRAAVRNVYVHVPFCRRRCPFCYIPVQLVGSLDLNFYLQAVCREIEHRAKALSSSGAEVTIRQVYVGGGTPSLCAPEALGAVLASLERAMPVVQARIATVEILPKEIGEGYFERLLAAGFNRVAVGVQTFDDQRLARLQRPYSGHEAADCLRQAKRAGVDSVACELMWGYADADEQAMSGDFCEAVEAGATEVSFQWYNVDDGCIQLTAEERSHLLRIFRRTQQAAADNGYRHCNAETFCLPGKQVVPAGLNGPGISGTSYGAIFAVGWQGVSYLGRTSGKHAGTLADYLETPWRYYVEETVSEEDFHRVAMLYELATSMEFGASAFLDRFHLADLSESPVVEKSLRWLLDDGVVEARSPTCFGLTAAGQALLDASMATMGIYNRGGAVP